jgi:hypothetical protein
MDGIFSTGSCEEKIMPDMQVRAGLITCFITGFYYISDVK